jgi:hypothetical protein
LTSAWPIPTFPEYKQEIRQQKKQASAVAPFPGRARPHQLAQDQTQVERSHVDQLSLQNVLVAAKMRAPHAAGFVAVGKATFHQLAAPP